MVLNLILSNQNISACKYGCIVLNHCLRSHFIWCIDKKWVTNRLLEMHNKVRTLGKEKVFIVPEAGEKLTLGWCSHCLHQDLKQDSGQRLQGGKNMDTGDFLELLHQSFTSIPNMNLMIMLYWLISAQLWDIHSLCQFSDLQSIHSSVRFRSAGSWGQRCPQLSRLVSFN